MPIDTKARDFSDTRVFVVGVNDPETGCIHPPDYLGVAQSFYGPRFVIVGPDVSDAKLHRNIGDLSSRYKVTLPQLKAIRELQLKQTPERVE